MLTNIHKNRGKNKAKGLQKPSFPLFKVVVATGMRIKENLKLEHYHMRPFSNKDSFVICLEPSTLRTRALCQNCVQNKEQRISHIGVSFTSKV